MFKMVKTIVENSNFHQSQSSSIGEKTHNKYYKKFLSNQSESKGKNNERDLLIKPK